MVTGKKTQICLDSGSGSSYPNLANSFEVARNLEKNQLGGVIFGCQNSTMKECLTEQLFGLPAQHISYVKNINPGLPLFLFNNTERKLYGIFEAASSGQMNINPYGWIAGNSRRTLYPAQVQVRVQLQCQPLLEDQFKPIIASNYYRRNHFWFELDHDQTRKLTSLFMSFVVAPRASVPQCTVKRAMFPSLLPPHSREEVGVAKPLASEVEHSNHSSLASDSVDVFSSLDGNYQPLDDELYPQLVAQEEKDLIFKKLQELAQNLGSQDSSSRDSVGDSAAMSNGAMEKNSAEDQLASEENEDSPCTSSKCRSIIAELVQGIEELKAFKTEQIMKMDYLEQKLFEAEKEIQQLRGHCETLESASNPSTTCITDKYINSVDELHPDPTESIYVIGGYNGDSWLSALDSYFPSQDVIKSLKPMAAVRSYASVAKLYNELFVFGGGDGRLWYDTVESYNPANDQWTLHPTLTAKKGSLAGATLGDKIFAIGGGNEVECFSDVEMLDLDVGHWIPTRSMLQKRFALAAVELDGVLYATGGFDGNDYLKSAERFDPREYSWTKIANMNLKRGCHSLVVLNDKLYALGGFDGNAMVSSTEVFDPRLGSWISGDSMNAPRGYAAAAVVNEFIYVLGGLESDEKIVETVERFKEGQGWQKNGKTTMERCFMSAIAL